MSLLSFKQERVLYQIHGSRVVASWKKQVEVGWEIKWHMYRKGRFGINEVRNRRSNGECDCAGGDVINLFSPLIVISSAAGPRFRGKEKHNCRVQKSKHWSGQWARFFPTPDTFVIKHIVRFRNVLLTKVKKRPGGR